MERAADQCTFGRAHATDNGTSLILGTPGEEDTAGVPLTQVACVLDRLDVPDAVIAQMDGTRALDGRQTAEWPGYTASWTYHPDDGLDLIIQESGD
jgi:hypothetical protein